MMGLISNISFSAWEDHFLEVYKGHLELIRYEYKNKRQSLSRIEWKTTAHWHVYNPQKGEENFREE